MPTDNPTSAQVEAKRLIDSFKKALEITDMRATVNPYAKQCAILCVNEILKENLFLSRRTHWQQVLKEVEGM